MLCLDLNCDLGEGSPGEADLMPLVTSANIACGGHAGDVTTMRAAVQLAQRHNIAMGAHPSYVDQEHFGRRERVVTPDEVYELILSQTRRLQAIIRAEGEVLHHVKPHGALYNQAARDPVLADAVLDAMVELGRSIILFAPAASILLAQAARRGLPVASEVFGDRTYQPDGSLTPRNGPDALISDEGAAVAQVLRLAQEGKVCAVDGTDVALVAHTVCVHGDGPNALALVRALRQELARAGIALRAPNL